MQKNFGAIFMNYLFLFVNHFSFIRKIKKSKKIHHTSSDRVVFKNNKKRCEAKMIADFSVGKNMMFLFLTRISVFVHNFHFLPNLIFSQKFSFFLEKLLHKKVHR